MLHPSFPEPIQGVCHAAKTKFSYSATGWGVFTVKVNVRYKDGHVETLEHKLAFGNEPPVGPLAVSVNNRSKQIEPGWWEWVSMSTVRRANWIGSVASSPRCTRHLRTRSGWSADRPSRFERVARGWGTFTIGVKLMLKDGSVRQLNYPLQLR